MPVTKEKLIKQLKVGEEVYFSDYKDPFTVKSINKTGLPEATIKNDRTELKLRGDMKVRSTKIYGR